MNFDVKRKFSLDTSENIQNTYDRWWIGPTKIKPDIIFNRKIKKRALKVKIIGTKITPDMLTEGKKSYKIPF